ncbi:Starvation-sensing protein rspA [uncultured Ruminococcus sp.]|uniref:Starvation-sensing protein RspA n=1 Tax=Massiliimalia timonensis TaxID=1987501 RepID=A0A8J6PC30_9FIRM|nr:enolase C-terminal domain-like protein [Massiliimalia timonensis]MBC8610688.1 starvation-sensing protein RspA [Massiliimalia timonensis]MBS7174899.1 starvation-sensing protein RspA [Clostridiales bacterium]SCH94449.1 Starvation-sensing protein rspA [uncultured Clostridium sp.]SCI27246.1 Starvation-sensing protein rspA [uncultured Ruminococcus sp.]
MGTVTIRDVRAICTAPDGINLTVVKVETSEPGLYGLGCATFAYRTKAVRCVVEEYLKPLLVGRDASRIEDLWQLMNVNAYWRNGPISNNAVSGVDQALWDIKGKMAGMPVYELLGGKCREAVPLYLHADGRDFPALSEKIHAYLEAGVRYIRCQIGTYGGGKMSAATPPGSQPGMYLDPDQYARATVALFEKLRAEFGFEAEFCHDVHERVQPVEALRLAKQLEPYRLFFLEDLLSPEQGDWYRLLRQQTATPIAVGELFNNPKEFDFLIANRLIDFIRCHTSQLGGLTPARKLAAFAEVFGVRTAWHGPGDVSPVGHAANIHLDLATSNLGIQEWTPISETLAEVFPGCPVQKGGYIYANDRPGFGIDLDEKLAAKYPCEHPVTQWTQTRLVDGTVIHP